MMDFDTVNNLVGSMGTIKFFPSDSAARLGLVETMSDLTEDEDQARWLVKKMRTEYREWPGEHEMRRVFCENFRPRDGIVVQGGAERDYTFKLKPSQRWPPMSDEEYRKSLFGPSPKQLAEAPMCEKSQAIVQDLVERMPKMPSARPIGDKFEKHLLEVLTPPADRPMPSEPTPQIITQADIDREKQKIIDARHIA
jgi:hypothetical protein